MNEVKQAWANKEVAQYKSQGEWHDWFDPDYINFKRYKEWRVKPKSVEILGKHIHRPILATKVKHYHWTLSPNLDTVHRVSELLPRYVEYCAAQGYVFETKEIAEYVLNLIHKQVLTPLIEAAHDG